MSYFMAASCLAPSEYFMNMLHISLRSHTPSVVTLSASLFNAETSRCRHVMWVVSQMEDSMITVSVPEAVVLGFEAVLGIRNSRWAVWACSILWEIVIVLLIVAEVILSTSISVDLRVQRQRICHLWLHASKTCFHIICFSHRIHTHQMRNQEPCSVQHKNIFCLLVGTKLGAWILQNQWSGTRKWDVQPALVNFQNQQCMHADEISACLCKSKTCVMVKHVWLCVRCSSITCSALTWHLAETATLPVGPTAAAFVGSNCSANGQPADLCTYMCWCLPSLRTWFWSIESDTHTMW